MSISSDEVTFLILRYFKECGFEHSHYTYVNESSIDTSQITGFQIPPGALITLLQKGLLYTQLERNIANQGRNRNGYSSQISLLNAALRGANAQNPNECGDDNAVHIPFDSVNSIMLSEHNENVLCCEWSPDSHFLATGSEDNSAIIWDVQNSDAITQYTLPHGDAETSNPKEHQVTLINWSPDGSHLATGCSDGTFHVFKSNGTLCYEKLVGENAVHVVKFNKTGTHILVGSGNTKVTVHLANSGDETHSFATPNETNDAAWRSDVSFAIACSNGHVGVIDNFDSEPRWFIGHKESANCIAWEPNEHRYLASCSDDKTVRIWSVDDEQPPIVLREHTKPVYFIRWSKSGIVASAAFDSTVILWDPVNGTPRHILKGHQKPINALSFSPCERLIVSGSCDQTVKFWDTETGQLVSSFIGQDISMTNIFDIQYSPDGKYVAICFSGGNIVLLRTDAIKRDEQSADA